MRYLTLLVSFFLGACDSAEEGKTATTASGGVGNTAGQATGGSGTGPGGSGGAGTAGSGAGAAGSGAGTYCDVWAARLRECEILGAGRYAGCSNYGDAAERCEIECVRSASCAAVDELFCADGDEIFECQGICIGEMPVVCGDGTRFPYDYRCDGVDDCASGEDEAGCTEIGTVKCRNADQRVAGTAVCDGVRDCPDGSDEPADCSALFTCTDGTALPELYACDGFVDCADESDEPTDCARATCD